MPGRVIGVPLCRLDIAVPHPLLQSALVGVTTDGARGDS